METTLPTPEVVPKDRLVRVFLRIREKREELTRSYKEAYAALTTEMDQIEGMLLKLAQDEGVTGFKTPDGTTYTETETQVSIADANAFFEFVLAEGDLDFLQRRVKVESVTNYMKAHGDQPPPGLSIFRRVRMKFRSPSRKVEGAE